MSSRSRRTWGGLSAAVGFLLVSALLAACSGNGSAASQRHAQSDQQRQASAPVATVQHLPPTVVPIATTSSATPTPAKSPPRQVTSSTSSATHSVPAGPDPVGGVPNIGGQLLLVSLSQQWMWAYQNRQLVYRAPITSGMPELPTPDGVFHIQYHEANVWFSSPWPQGSPYYYTPVKVDYALYFLDWGFFVHDAPWRNGYVGPGTNYPHTDPDGAQRTGSHGCIEVSTAAGAWLYSWTHDGATIDIYGTAPVPAATAAPTSTPAPTATNTPQPTSTATDTPVPSATSTP